MGRTVRGAKHRLLVLTLITNQMPLARKLTGRL